MRATRWSSTAYECPACGEWHDESERAVEEVSGWLCNACDGFHEGDTPEAVRAIETEGSAFILEEHVDGLLADYWPCPDDDDQLSGEPVPTSRWRYECGELGDEEDRPETIEAWQCGECEEVYADRDEAKECCRD